METKVIKLKQQTAEILDKMKIIPRESYDDVVNRLIQLSNVEDELELSTSTKERLKTGIKNIEKGNIFSTSQMEEIMKKRFVDNASMDS